MPADVVERWLRSGGPANVDGIALRPVEHKGMPGMPLSVQRGQAEAFCLAGSDGSRWVLKKFHPGRRLDRSYLEGVATVLPDHGGLLSGTDRSVLSVASLHKEHGFYYTPDLARWLHDTVLMPRVNGVDWATIADGVRDGSIKLERPHRLALLRGLTDIILLLEERQCAHRDLSSGNVFVNCQAWMVLLIDFDSVFHPALAMPNATTCGTEGYTPPYAWQGGALDPRQTWCQGADRFALCVLCVEFLILDAGAPLAAEGGMFEQEELRSRSGRGISLALAALKAKYPAAGPLFEAALRSTSFRDCPSPKDWARFCDSTPGAPMKPPRLDELESVSPDFFDQLLAKARPAAPLWPAPRLADMPAPTLELPRKRVPVVSLPPDPW
ncbi:MAG: hypothetical protein FJ291_00130 [Planctomycetes bacterium]|nr:hypothetical protein [Planctomycetota bacterium]